MIVCEQCGHQNDSSDTFCGSCGAFLEWQGHKIDEPKPEPEPEVDEAAHDPGRPGFVQRVKAAIGIEDGSGGTGDEAAPRHAAPPAGAAAGQPGGAGAGADASAEAEEARRQAAAERAAAEAAAERARRDAERASEDAERAERLAAEQAEAAARGEAEAEAERARRDAEAAAALERQEAEAAAGRSHQDAEATATLEGEEARASAVRERQGEEADRRRREAEEAEAAARQRQEAEAATARQRQEAEEAEAAARQRQEAEAAAARARQEAEEAATRTRQEAEAARRRAQEVAAAQVAAEAAAERARVEEAKREEAARRAAAMVAQPRKAPSAPPPAPGPAAVQPTEERRRPAPRQPQAPAPVVKPGDLICGQCGEGNDPARNFCRRCGHTLAQAEVARLPWHRRLFRRRRRVIAAGERPGRATAGGGGSGRGGRSGRGAISDAKMAGRKVKSVTGKFRRLAALLLIVGVGVAFLGPFRGPANRAYQSVRRAIKPEYEPVRPVDAVASSSAAGHDAKAVIDGIKNTFWAEGAPGAGEKQTLTITFAQPTDLDKVGIIPGASEDPEQFVAQPRPRVLHLVFNGASPSAKDVTVTDAAEFQSFDVNADDVTSVLVELVSVHASTGGQDSAITELEFFRKK